MVGTTHGCLGTEGEAGHGASMVRAMQGRDAEVGR